MTLSHAADGRTSTDSPVARTILTRRSIKAFRSDPPPESLIEELLETAVWVPNHRMTQPWRFLLFTGDGRRLVAEARRARAMEDTKVADLMLRKAGADRVFQQALETPIVLAVAMKQSKDPVLLEEDFGSCFCIVQNFCLLACERGIGTHLKTWGDTPQMREALGLAPGERIVVWVQIGYPVQWPEPQPRVSARERTVWVRSAPPA